MLASADVAAGKKVFGKCKSCHTVTDGGKNGIGPNLWNIVNAGRGAKAGFGYSKALAAKPGNWTYESLNAFLAKPKNYIKGTKMTFAGLGKAKDRANVIAYLRSAAATPAPLPSQADIDKAMQALEAAKLATADADRTMTAPAKKAVAKAVPAMPKQNITEMLANADTARGKKVFGKCKACHTVANGGKNGIGPNLWNIVNRKTGAVDGFKYSKVLRGMSDKPWNYENLNAFLIKPKAYAKGTKMTFAGLKKDSDRANLIAYLRSLSDSPAPIK
jgi:cytochrome c